VKEEEEEVKANVLRAKARVLARERAAEGVAKGRNERMKAARAALAAGFTPTPAPTWLSWTKDVPSPVGRVLLINPTMQPTAVPSATPTQRPTAIPTSTYKLTGSATDDDDDDAGRSKGGVVAKARAGGKVGRKGEVLKAKEGKRIRCEKLSVTGQRNFQTVRMGVYHLLWEPSPRTHDRPVYSMASPSNFIYYFATPGPVPPHWVIGPSVGSPSGGFYCVDKHAMSAELAPKGCWHVFAGGKWKSASHLRFKCLKYGIKKD
jgi:hypothetical protein